MDCLKKFEKKLEWESLFQVKGKQSQQVGSLRQEELGYRQTPFKMSLSGNSLMVNG